MSHKAISLRKRVFVLNFLDKYIRIYDVILAQKLSEEAFFILRNYLVFFRILG